MKKYLLFAFVTLGLIMMNLGFSNRVLSAAIKDTESASHADDAASYQVVDTYSYPGFKVIQFNLSVLSHYSYMLISNNQALVVDPGRDVFVYLDKAEKEGAKIVGVFLTHSHADFIAGHMELAKAAGCPIYINAASGAGYDFKPLKDGATLVVGEAAITFVATPGHTPDGLCAFVYSGQKKDSPEVIFTGDTLFVGSIGRPDLMEGTLSAAALASMAFDSWHNKLSKAGDSAVIFPAHGAGSLCGAHLSDQPKSTIGAEKASNPYFVHQSRSDFIAAVLDGLPEAPQYFKHNAAANKKGPELIAWQAPLPKEMPPEKTLSDPSKFYLVDLRDAAQYAAGHIPNSVNIGVRGRFESWVGTMVPWGANLVLCGSQAELKEAAYRLHRVGYRAQVIAFENWQKSGLPVAKSDMIQPADLYSRMQKGDGPVIVDVRLPSEWMGLRIGTVVNLPLTHLSELSTKLDPTQPVVAVCNSAYRSSMAVGLLERKGFKQVGSLAGGSEAWISAGLPVFGADQKTAAGSSASATAPKRTVKLPERIAASELKSLIMDLPGTFELVDIRPPAQYADYSIPGSQNADVAEVMSNPAYLTGAGALILVDRDGSLAMAVAGILSQKTQRPIKALYGGVVSYWQESELKNAVKPVDIQGAGGGAGGAAPRTPGMTERPAGAVAAPETAPKGSSSPPPPAPAPPQPAKSKSAGC